MEMHIRIFVMLCCLSTAYGLVCFTCKFGASSMKECSRKGRFEKCQTENSACATVVRRQYEKMSVFKKCKQKQACSITMIKQNYAPDGNSTQCNNDRPVSKCSCCCSKDKCNFGEKKCEMKDKLAATTKKKNIIKKHILKKKNIAKKRKDKSKTYDVKKGKKLTEMKSAKKQKTIAKNNNTKKLKAAAENNNPKQERNVTEFKSTKKQKTLTENNNLKKQKLVGEKSNTLKQKNITETRGMEKKKTAAENAGNNDMKKKKNITENHITGSQKTAAETNHTKKEINMKKPLEPRVSNPPECALITPMEHGNMTCSNGNQMGSVCEFHCQSPDYLMMPQENKRLECRGSQKWNMEKPICQPTCPRLREEPHGYLECSSSIRKAGSYCVVKCNDTSRYEVRPKRQDKLRCKRSTKWDRPQGCCTLKCPPHIIADILVLMHASTNKSYEIFHQIIDIGYKNLVRSDKDGFLIAMMEFSGGLQPQNFFKFSDTMKRNYSSLTQSHVHYNLNKLTNIGRALAWSFRLFRGYGSGNRKHVPDFVIIATDTTSTDPVQAAAKKWRDDGAFLYVLTQKGPNGKHPSRKEMMKITEDSSRIIRYEGNVATAAGRILKAQKTYLCPKPCQHLSHEHYEEKQTKTFPSTYR